MKFILRLCGAALAVTALVAAIGQASDPAEILKSFTDLRMQRMREAREANKTLDAAALTAEIRAKADEAVKNLDHKTLDPKKGNLWAQVYQTAGKHKEACDLCEAFLKTGPSPEEKFAAQMLMLNSCNELGEADMLVMTLGEVSAPGWAASQQLARSVAFQYSDTIAKAKGIDAALKALDDAEKQIRYEAPEDYAKRLFASTKARQPKNADGSPKTDEQIQADLLAASKGTNDTVRFTVVGKKADLLSDAGRKEYAVRLLDEFIGSVDPSSPALRRAKSTRTQLTIVGSAAPELVYGRKHGEFKSLAEWIGKVVIVDFTAHW